MWIEEESVEFVPMGENDLFSLYYEDDMPLNLFRYAKSVGFDWTLCKTIDM